MKAMVWTAYGPPDVLQLQEVAKPMPKANEVLIKVHAATVTAGDCEVRALKIPILYRLPLRLYVGVAKPHRITILGQELAGEIEAVGNAVTRFKPGDQVFAATLLRFGAYAEYACLPETYPIVLKPANMSYAEAATIPTGGINALHFLRKTNPQPGESILINGAGGSIGTYAVQIAKSMGAEVTCVDSTPKLAMLRSIGADHVIDYTAADFTKNGKTYDVIIDVVGKSSFSRSIRALAPNGRYLLGNPTLPGSIRGRWTSKTTDKQVISELADYKMEAVIFLKEMIEAGKLKAVIDKRYGLEQTVEAHRYVEQGHKKGNVNHYCGGKRMKAIVYQKYGSPDMLAFKEVAKPTPKANEVLVKIHAAAANPLDWHLMRAEPFLVRLGGGLLKPKNPLLGADIAGRVEAVGKNVTQFQPGDAVFGEVSGSGLGGFAEYVCAREDGLALKPANLSFAAAAAVPVAAFTALQGLRDTGQIQPGQKVLVNGASGGVGTFAVQIAKAFGTEVTGVCSTRNLELVRSIGADHVIDYTQADFTKSGQQYDLIFDAVGNRSVADYQRALRPNGICSIAGFTTLSHLFQVLLLGAWVSRSGGKKIALMGVAQSNKKDLVFIKELLEAGKVVPVIDRCYPLAETADAIRYLETGRARGKVIITVEPTDKA